MYGSLGRGFRIRGLGFKALEFGTSRCSLQALGAASKDQAFGAVHWLWAWCLVEFRDNG